MKKKLILGIVLFAVIIGAGIGISKLVNPPEPVTQYPKTVTVYGAVGGGKENFLADPDVNRIMAEKYGISVQNDPWSNGKLIRNELTYTDKNNGSTGTVDFVFFSDQRYYEAISDFWDDGDSADMYTIKKPKPVQLNFYGQNVWQDHVTVYRDQLDVAFHDPDELPAH